MAEKPRMMVRLAPSTLHALQWIAERETTTPAELARLWLSADVQHYLEKSGLRAQCQDAYMAWLTLRRDQGEDVRDVVAAADIDVVDGEDLEPADDVHVEPTALYGAVGDQMGLPITEWPTAASWSEVQEEALVDVARIRSDGRKRRV